MTIPWYESRRFHVGACVVLGGFLIVSAVQGIFQRDNDFLWHYAQGSALLHGQSYSSHQHYLVGRHLLNVVMAVPPYRLSRALVYGLALVCLVVVFRRWNRMADLRGTGPPIILRTATTLTLLILLAYLFRDFDDCGLQVIFLFMLTSAGWALTRGKVWQTGVWLALATTYKTPAALFLPFLVYKRRWREAASLLMCVALFNAVLPAVLLGPAVTKRAWTQFLAVGEQAALVRDPSLNPMEPPKHQNQSLRLSLARLVQEYPPEHPLAVPVAPDMDRHRAVADRYYDWLIDFRARGQAAGQPPHADPAIRTSPFFIQLASLSPSQANIVVTVMLLMLAGILAWRFRKPWTDPATDADLPVQWATVTALCALLSPLCWMHHLVLVLPALLLVLRGQLGRPQAMWRRLVFGYVAFTLVFLIYDLTSRHGWLLVIANGLHTWACMGVLLLLLTLPPQDRQDRALSTTSSTVTA